MFFRHRADQML